MERYYDGDQEALFKAAHVINPYVKPKRESKVMAERVFICLCVSHLRQIKPTTFKPTHTHLDEEHFKCFVSKILSNSMTSGKMKTEIFLFSFPDLPCLNDGGLRHLFSQVSIHKHDWIAVRTPFL